MKPIKTFCLASYIFLGLLAFGTIGVAYAKAQDKSEQKQEQQVAQTPAGAEHSEPAISKALESNGGIFYAIAITIGIACISAGYAVAKVGSAALGAAAEKPELLGKALIFVGLAEGIAIYGLIIAIMMVMKL